jgi:hypothetical protein
MLSLPELATSAVELGSFTILVGVDETMQVPETAIYCPNLTILSGSVTVQVTCTHESARSHRHVADHHEFRHSHNEVTRRRRSFGVAG